MPYPGGKAGAGTYQRIINQIPPHDTYIEACAGDCAIFRNKRRAHRNILIEIDPHQAQVLAAEFRADVEIYNCDCLEWLKHHFHLYRLASVEASARRGSTAATSNGMAGQNTPPHPPAWAPYFIYLDPPYLRSTRRDPRRRIYRYEFTEAQHIDLLSIIQRIPCPIAISGYNSPLYSAALQNWRRIHFTAATRGRTAIESLWANYPEPEQLHDYRHLGNEKRERERITRKVRTWSAGLLRLPQLERQAIIAGIAGTPPLNPALPAGAHESSGLGRFPAKM